MKQFSEQHIFGSVPPSGFFGRESETEKLLKHSRGNGGLVLLATPGAGSSELLKQVFDRLFAEQEEVIPVYFAIKQSDGSALQAARRFLREFLVQTVAFRRRNAFILDASPDINEIAELAVPADALWVDRLIETAGEYGNDDEISRLRSFLSSPIRAAASGANVFIIVDDLHETANLSEGRLLLEALTEVFSRCELPFVFCGHRRFLYSRTPFETLQLSRLSFADSGSLAESLAAEYGVSVNEQTRDLIAVQLQGDPRFMSFLFASAAEKGVGFDSFQKVETVFTDEIFGGRISRYFDAIFESVATDAASRSQLIGMIADLHNNATNRASLEFWQRHTCLEFDAFRRVISKLNDLEIISTTANSVGASPDNIVAADHIAARHRLNTESTPRAQIVGEVLTNNIRRAPRLMAKFYRQLSAIGLRELMRGFDGREVASSLIDYAKFKTELKGMSNAEIQSSITASKDKVTLPQIVYTAHSAAFYPQLGGLIDTERSAIALGFESGCDKNEIVWIAAEIDSKLEAAADLAEFWCDRLEMVAASCDFSEYKIWLVAPEGFSDEALRLIANRNAIGSSRRQVDLLVRQIGTESLVPADAESDEYEIVIPMGEDTEMIAAHTIEEIAKRHDFPAKAINQIKTALVEACINAAEHSHSPDRKIYQKFAVTNNRIAITVSNRGLRLADKAAKTVTSETGRRGWGLKLIQGLMDEVKVEQTDDGTRITMVKFVSR